MKAVNLPDKIADDLAKVSEELTLMAKKPISQSMAVNLLIEVYHAHLNNRCALDAFSQQLQSLDVMSPEEFDNYWDEPSKPSKPQAAGQKGKPRSRRQLGVRPK
jgi:hypothetical protein